LVENRYQGPREDIPDQQFAEGIAREAAFQPVKVDFESVDKNAVPVRVQVTDFGRRVELDGLLGTYRFRFEGDPELFWLRPSRWSTGIPYGDVQGQFVTVGVQGPNDPERIRDDLKRHVDMFREYVGWQQAQIEEHNKQLWRHVLPLIEQRKRMLHGVTALRDIL
jgi:hypothetical protein